jgi:S1-C subfamily serine protease
MERTLAALSLSFEELAERVSPAVVQIIARGLAPTQSGLRVRRNYPRPQCSSALPSPAESRAALKSVIKSAGKQVSARVVGLDRKTDITMLKAKKKWPFIFRFGSSSGQVNLCRRSGVRSASTTRSPWVWSARRRARTAR